MPAQRVIGLLQLAMANAGIGGNQLAGLWVDVAADRGRRAKPDEGIGFAKQDQGRASVHAPSVLSRPARA